MCKFDLQGNLYTIINKVKVNFGQLIILMFVILWIFWFDNKEFRGAAKPIFRGADYIYATSILGEIAQPSSGVVF